MARLSFSTHIQSVRSLCLLLSAALQRPFTHLLSHRIGFSAIRRFEPDGATKFEEDEWHRRTSQSQKGDQRARPVDPWKRRSMVISQQGDGASQGGLFLTQIRIHVRNEQRKCHPKQRSKDRIRRQDRGRVQQVRIDQVVLATRFRINWVSNTGRSRWILTKMDKKTMTMPADR